MAHFVAAVTTTVQRNNEAEEPVLTALSTRPAEKRVKAQTLDQQATGQRIHNTEQKTPQAQAADTPLRCSEGILQALKSQPNVTTLAQVLQQLRSGHGLPADFSIDAIGPQQAQIINTLLSIILPHFWSTLPTSDRKLLASCLRNVAGLSAVVARLRLVTDGFTSKRPSPGSKTEELRDLLELTTRLFDQPHLTNHVWQGLTKAVPDFTKRLMSWKEFVNLVGSGKVITTVARAEDALKVVADASLKHSWICNGTEYATWLGENIMSMTAERPEDPDTSQAASLLLSKAFSLGYSIPLVKGVLTSASIISPVPLLSNLPSFTKRQFVESTLHWLSHLFPIELPSDTQYTNSDSPLVSSLAACLHLLVHGNTVMQQHLQSFLLDSALLTTTSIPVRRAAVSALSAVAAADEFQNVLEKLLTTIGDPMFINHAPIVQQESVIQVLLLSAGYLHRQLPMAVFLSTRSSGHMAGTSNRLHSSNSRARWLGTVVATAISSLVDKEGSRMNFDTTELQNDEARWYQGLVKVNDAIGTMHEFGQLVKPHSSVVGKLRARVKTQELPTVNGKQTFGPPLPPVRTEVIGDKVTEVLDDEEEDDDDDLKPYARPDSDAEDSDEDATLVNHNKARPPVYVRDLMRMLREDKDHDKFQLAIKHAAALIRRKTNFGGEVKDHVEELALILCDLQDPFDIEDFDELKLQALIALLLSDVEQMAPWLSRQVFSGDYSLSQRCIMLSALGLGGRELAGAREQDELNPALPHTSFPSKKLPARLHAVYDVASTSVKRLEAASSNVERAIMQPLALSAADQTTSHLSAVKIKKFSSRMEVERTKRKPAANRLAKLFADYFFNPMATRYQQDVTAYGQRSVFASVPTVQVTFVKTLALLLHASGPATLGLNEVTSSLWDLLLCLRIPALNDVSILEAVLFALLTLLEVNCEWGDKARLAQDEPKRLAETQSWVQIVFERTGAGELVVEGSGNETRVRTMAAGVLVKCGEIIEGYQRGLMGGLKT